ncbi:MAG: hypothetical protein Q8K82_16515 [Gemmatimonadaceae bacterium]|nr:hypothetical protein [Gemmatimonadaceae bacterium]
MPLFRTILMLSLALPALLSAQRSAQQVPAGVDRHVVTSFSSQRTGLLRQLSDTAPARTIPMVPVDSVRRRKIGRYTINGLGIGAAIGIGGGLIASKFIACGCSAPEKAFGLAFWYGGIGASAGGIIGALVGGIADLRAR